MPQLTDSLTRHQVYLQRYAGTQVRLIAKDLRKLATKIRARIASEELTEGQLARLQLLQRDIERLIGASVTGSTKRLDSELKRLAEYEAEHTLKVYAPAVTVKMAGLSEVGISKILTESPMQLVQGGKAVSTTLQDAYRAFSRGVARDVGQTIRAGVVEAKTTQQIAREVNSLVNTRSRRQAETLVRTATNHIANSARAEVYAANSDIISHEEFVATLDDRTTITCASLDGNTYPIGQGPQPPMHYGCRSLRVAVVDPKYQIPGMGNTRASVDGPVSGSTTYASWLAGQSAEFQNDVLGPERAALFRSGEVPLSRFTDDNGIVFTLDELRAREGL